MTASWRSPLALIALALLASAADAIVRRHDRPDSDYLALAASAPAVARVSPDGAGVLIAPRWVLTAAHVAQEANVFSSVEIAGESIAVTGFALHDSWRGDLAPGTHDLALLELARPAQAAPVALFTGDDEVGRAVLFFGWGDVGSGDSGPTGNDGQLRGAENRVTTAGPAAVRFRFDAPPDGEPLEGVSGPGDSGGPALVRTPEGAWQVLGVSSAASGGEPGRYGIEEVYARVSTARAWIERTQRDGVPAAQKFAPPRALGGTGELAATGGEGIARAFVEATAKSAVDDLVAFDRAHRSAAALARSPEARAGRYRELLERHGALTPLAVGAESNGRLPLLVRGAKSGSCLGFVFLFEGSPPKLDGYFSGAAACAAAP